MFKPSYELKKAIDTDMIPMGYKAGDKYTAAIVLDDLDKKLKEEFLDWFNKRKTYFQTSYTAYKLTYGDFEGLFPALLKRRMDGREVLYFIHDCYKKPDWKEWFIIEKNS